MIAQKYTAGVGVEDLTDAEIKDLQLLSTTAQILVAQVSDTQFIQALAEWGIIEWSDAQAWGSKGDLPRLLVTALDKIEDATTRNRAYMKAMSAKTYIYSDPWLQLLASKLDGWDKDKLQQLFNFAATL